MAHLRVFSPDGPMAGESIFPLEQEQIVIGRDPGCDLVLQGVGASRRHAIIQWAAAGWMLVDQGSANGTLVQGQRVANHELRNGDTVQMGDSRLVFEDGSTVSPVPQWIWCSRCGAPAASGTWICAACGQSFAGTTPTPEKEGGRGRWYAGCGCLLAVMAVVGLAAFILWRAGGVEGLTRRSIRAPRITIQEGGNQSFRMKPPWVR